MAILGAAYNIGFIFGPGLGGLLARPDEGPEGFQLPLLVASGLAGLLGDRHLPHRAREPGAPTTTAPQGPNRWTMLGRALSHPVVGRLMVLTFVAGLAFNGIESTFGFWTPHRYGWKPATSASASRLGDHLGARARRC